MPIWVNDVLQYILSGIAIGCIYGLVALGFVLIYKATEVVNFAQGELMMIGAFIAYTFVVFLNLNYWLAFLFTVCFMWVFGMLLDRVVLRPLVGEPVFAIVMVTIGFGILARSVVSMIPGWGTDTFSFKTPFAEKAVKAGGLVVSWEHLSIIVLSVALVLLFYLFFKYTRIGIALQATAQNQLAAVYMGISIKKVFSLTWAISAAVAAFAGVLLSPITMVHMNMGFIGLKAFPAAVLGGFGSIPGAIVGGLIIGITESLAGVYLPIGWKDIAAFIILILVLMIRPEGLFGIQQKKKV
jgi:branched-chain amino acid transport system permease protein